MATKIITKNSSTATSIPTAGDLVQGELAVNVTDKRLFTEDSGGAIVELGTNPSTLTAGAATFSGNVGIGTSSSPATTLHITKDGNQSAVLDAYEAQQVSHNTIAYTRWVQNASGIANIMGVDSSAGILGTSSNHALAIRTNNTERLRIDSAGAATFNGTVTAGGLTTNGASEGDTYFTGGTASSRLLNVFTSTHDGAANAGHNFKIASGQGAFIFGNNTTANLLTVKSGGIDVTGAAMFSGEITTTSGPINVIPATTTTYAHTLYQNASGLMYVGRDSSAGASLLAGSSAYAGVINVTGAYPIEFGTNNVKRMTLDASGNLGLGVTPSASWTGSVALQIGTKGSFSSSGSFTGLATNTVATSSGWATKYITDGAASVYLQATSDGSHRFYTAPVGTAGATSTITEHMRLDASGNLLVGKTAADGGVNGGEIRANGETYLTTTSAPPLVLSRKATDGALLNFGRDGAGVGSIGANGGVVYVTGPLAGGLKYSNYDSTHASIFPCTTIGGIADNLHDLGYSGSRFDDIYATNATIQTSDRNEKQDIEALSDAETAVAVACKGLLRKFRWIDSVEEKGDDARIHFGIIAQDLQAAFEAEGLDAGRYAMFISSTWWETQTEVDAVEAVEFVQAVEAVYDEDGELVSEAVEGVEAVEAKDAYTRTDTFQTLADAPEGATERTRLGIRYSELLAFIIAAI